MPEALVMTGVSRHFMNGGQRVSAVQRVDLRIDAGELGVLLGRSGSGKTTLLGLAGGLDRAHEGQVVLAGVDVASLVGSELDRFRQRTVGWVFQTSGLLPLLTAAENVAIALRLQGLPASDCAAAAMSALAAVGLEERAAHRAYELSGGEQQRVALARAIVKKPRLLLADEPTGQLDSETAHSVMGQIRQATTSGIAVLVATHDAALAEMADRVYKMQDGRLV